MRDEPSPDLVKKLAATGLATREQLFDARRHARRLARDLPLFESVWVDALVQARTLTPYQATEINAGHTTQLRVGPYVIRQVLSQLSYGTCYAAREIDTSCDVWLVVLHGLQNDHDSVAESLLSLCKRTRQLESDHIAAFEGAGVVSATGTEKVWVAYQATPGVSAADWMVPEGRFPPDAVLEIARQMVVALATLEQQEIVHGDLCARGLLLEHEGHVRLLLPGLRAIVRPQEGYAHTDCHPDAYDYLAPERIDRGTPPTVESDLHACGLLWWHLLTGRAPLAGGNALAKVKAAQAAKITDVRRLAPETPAVLLEAIQQCTERDPADRPASFAILAEQLGSATQEGRLALAACLTSQAPLRSRLVTAAVTARRSRHTPVWSAALAGCLLVVAAITWPRWHEKVLKPLAYIGALKAVGSHDPQNISVAAKPPADRKATGPTVLPATSHDASRTDRPKTAGGRSHVAPRVAKPNELILPTHEVVHLDTKQLKSGQTVRGADGQRVRVVAPSTGLVVEVEDVRFENIDFIASIFASGLSPHGLFPHGPSAHEARASGDAQRWQTIISLQADSATFKGCSFQPEPAAAAGCVAIAWHGEQVDRPDRLPEGGRLRLVDCVFRAVTVGVDTIRSGPLEVEVDNVLHLGPGPLVRWHRAASLEESFTLQLLHCTLRDASSLIQWNYSSIPEQKGNVFVEAADCAFSLRSEGALVVLRGPIRPDELLTSLIWTGQGSLLSMAAHFANWYDGNGSSQPVDDAATTVDGLVMSRVEFAGAASDGPSASRLIDWSAPLRGDRPPGISPSPLVLPQLR